MKILDALEAGNGFAYLHFTGAYTCIAYKDRTNAYRFLQYNGKEVDLTTEELESENWLAGYPDIDRETVLEHLMRGGILTDFIDHKMICSLKLVMEMPDAGGSPQAQYIPANELDEVLKRWTWTILEKKIC